MDWDALVAEGAACRNDAARADSAASIRAAWSAIVASRAAFLREDWDRVRHCLREAMEHATRALAESQGISLLVECDIAFSCEVGKRVFGKVAEPALTKVGHSRTAIPSNVSDLEPYLTRLSHSIMASSEYVALVESYMAL